MLKLYDYIDTLIADQNYRQWFEESQLEYFASDIMNSLDIVDPDEIHASFDRAVQACNALHLPFYQHFERVYRFDGKNIMEDWKLSSMACYLIIINCNPIHENVARAQLYFAGSR